MTSSLIKLQARMIQALDGKREGGATAVEYGLLVALIAAAIIVTVALLGTQINGAFTKITDELKAFTPTGN